MKISKDEIIANAFKIGSPVIEKMVGEYMLNASKSEYRRYPDSCPENVGEFVPNLSSKLVVIFERKKLLTCSDAVTLTGASLSSVYRAMANLQRAGIIKHFNGSYKNHTGKLKSYQWAGNNA